MREAFLEWRPRVEEIHDLGEALLLGIHFEGRGKAGGAPIDQRVWQVFRVQDMRAIWWKIYATEKDARDAIAAGEWAVAGNRVRGPETQASVAEEIVHANGLEIAYERAGDGPPIVFLHGAAEDRRVWSPQLAALSDEFTVVAWDEPGAGRSSDLPAGFDLAGYSICAAGLIEGLGLGPAHVAGLSWGGTLALELYRHRPDLLRSLILADTYAGWRGSLPAEEVSRRVQDIQRMLAAPREEFDPAFPGLSPLIHRRSS